MDNKALVRLQKFQRTIKRLLKMSQQYRIMNNGQDQDMIVGNLIYELTGYLHKDI